MSSELNLDADFTLNELNLDADFVPNHQPDIEAEFNIKVIPDISNLATKNELEDAVTELDGKISDDHTDITNHISDKTNPHEVTKTQVGLGNVDNTSDLNKPISTATQTALNGKQDTISDLSTIRTNASNGQSAYNTIQNYGDIVTYNASNFATAIQGQKADTALQPNDDISELNNDVGYITSASLPTVNNSTITFQKNNITVGDINLNQSSNETINFNIPTTASDINAVPTSRTINSKSLANNISLNSSDVGALASTTTINDLTTTAQQSALNSNITSTLTAQITTNKNDIESIQGVIPSAATSSNQLADKNFVNSTVSTNTANFIGTFTSVADLEAYSGTLTNNDYAFVETTDTAGNTLYDRYKYTTATTPASWQFEYELNNSSFTAVQWSAINSGANTTNIGQIATNTNDISDINTTISGYGDIVTYDASDFATSAQGQKADTAIQTVKVNGTALTPDSSKAVDVIVPTQVQADWDETNTTSKAFIKNKPTIPTVPTNISAFNNDSGYITGITSTNVTDALGYTPYNSSNPDGFTSNIGTVTSVNGNLPDENGNVTIQGGGGGLTVDNFLSLTSENPVQNKVITQTLADFSSSVNIDSYLDSIISGNYSELPIVVQSSYNNDLDSIIGGTYVNV